MASAAPTSWWDYASQEGLLSKEPAGFRPNPSSTPSPHCGVSLAWLERLVGSIQHLEIHGDTTFDVFVKGIVPGLEAEGLKCSLWNLVPLEHRGCPDWYISHHWSSSFTETISQLGPLLSSTHNNSNCQEWKEGVMIWMDAVSLDLPVLRTPSKASSSGILLLDERVQVIQACARGVVAVVDKDLQMPTDLFHLFDTWNGIYPSYDITRLKVALPVDITAAFVLNLLVTFDKFDVAKSDCHLDVDKREIMGRVKHTSGVKKFNTTIINAWHCAISCNLRWNPSPTRRHLHCAVLLLCGDYGQAQAVMATMPELHDDDADILAVDKFYKMKAGPAGVMDRAACDTILISFGADKESAEELSKEMSNEGEDVVSFEAFKNWYMGNQRERKELHTDLSVGDLLKNVRLMAHMLEREGEWNMADVFRKHETIIASGKIGDVKAILAPPYARGISDWSDVINTAVEKAEFGSMTDASRCIYKLIVLNADIIDVAPADMPPMPRQDWDWTLQCQILHFYLGIVVRLLKRMGPAKKRYTESLELSLSNLNSVCPQASNAPPKAQLAPKRQLMRHMSNISAVREALEVMHGTAEPVNASGVRSAQLAMSIISAASREGQSLPSRAALAQTAAVIKQQYSLNLREQQGNSGVIGGHIMPLNRRASTVSFKDTVFAHKEGSTGALSEMRKSSDLEEEDSFKSMSRPGRRKSSAPLEDSMLDNMVKVADGQTSFLSRISTKSSTGPLNPRLSSSYTSPQITFTSSSDAAIMKPAFPYAPGHIPISPTAPVNEIERRGILARLGISCRNLVTKEVYDDGMGSGVERSACSMPLPKMSGHSAHQLSIGTSPGMSPRVSSQWSEEDVYDAPIGHSNPSFTASVKSRPSLDLKSSPLTATPPRSPKSLTSARSRRVTLVVPGGGSEEQLLSGKIQRSPRRNLSMLSVSTPAGLHESPLCVMLDDDNDSACVEEVMNLPVNLSESCIDKGAQPLTLSPKVCRPLARRRSSGLNLETSSGMETTAPVSPRQMWMGLSGEASLSSDSTGKPLSTNRRASFVRNYSSPSRENSLEMAMGVHEPDLERIPFHPVAQAQPRISDQRTNASELARMRSVSTSSNNYNGCVTLPKIMLPAKPTFRRRSVEISTSSGSCIMVDDGK